MPTQTSNKGKQGLASMTPEKQREIASKGGKAAHEQGTAHEWDSEAAVEAGRKGGLKVSQDRQHMSEIGKRGGSKSRGGGRKAKGSDSNATK